MNTLIQCRSDLLKKAEVTRLSNFQDHVNVKNNYSVCALEALAQADVDPVVPCLECLNRLNSTHYFGR